MAAIASLKKDTLAYQFGVRPAVQPRSIVHVPVATVIDQINKFNGMHTLSMLPTTSVVTFATKGNPERDALIFYMMNHAMSLIRARKHPYEPLGQYLPLVDEYFNMLAIRTVRMFFYLFMICTREARHSPDSKNGPFWMKLKKEFGGGFADFIFNLEGLSPAAATDRIYQSQSLGLHVRLGNHVNGMVRVFNDGAWGAAPSYGGPNWGKVASTLRDFVEGKTTAEMILVTAFTLAHNGGPIFNKGMMYEGYTPAIYKILDVQRSGQIPQLVAQKGVPESQHAEVMRIYAACHAVLGEEFEGHVDWFKVKALGGKAAYTQEQNDQLAKYGAPNTAKHVQEAKQAIAQVAMNKQALEAAGLIPVFDKQVAKKTEREHA